MTTNSKITSSHINLSRQYGCRAYMTVVTFTFANIVHRARRFFRADVPGTGRIELYTLEPFADQWTTCTELGWITYSPEDFLGYVASDPTSRRDRLATMLVDAAVTDDALGADQSDRFALMEMA